MGSRLGNELEISISATLGDAVESSLICISPRQSSSKTKTEAGNTKRNVSVFLKRVFLFVQGTAGTFPQAVNC